MQIELDRRIEKSGDRTRIELFQSAMVNTSINEFKFKEAEHRYKL